MLCLVKDDSPRDFYARDRNRLINGACGLLGKAYARPLEAIGDILNLIGFRVERSPLGGVLKSETNVERRCVVVCSNLERKLAFPDAAEGVMSFALAHELAHVRLHLFGRTMKTGAAEDAEADHYAGVFLVPRHQLCGLDDFRDLLAAGQAGCDLWQYVNRLALYFAVSRSCMVRQLEELSIVTYDRAARQLRLAA